MKYFDHSHFPLTRLIQLKRDAPRKVGVAIPVLNEARTIRETIEAIRSLGKIVDELIVVDSGSTDDSVSICQSMNVRVVHDVEAASALGKKLVRGKGWNMWASVHYLTTDIIAWIDGDIQNVDPSFVGGIIGPLLLDPRLCFVKGYYQRPRGDARVTEIMVRPFVNAFLPKVAQVIEPLSGEYGARRAFLEGINFYSGYSVDIAILLHALRGLKGDQIAQAYLGMRVHELQSVPSLGRMSASILSTMLDFGNTLEYIHLKKRIPRNLIQFESNGGPGFRPIRYSIRDCRLEALRENPAYAAKHGGGAPHRRPI